MGFVSYFFMYNLEIFVCPKTLIQDVVQVPDKKAVRHMNLPGFRFYFRNLFKVKRNLTIQCYLLARIFQNSLKAFENRL